MPRAPPLSGAVRSVCPCSVTHCRRGCLVRWRQVIHTSPSFPPASGRPIHPLLKRIMQIHVTEEARHLCFARHYLKQNVPRLGALKRFLLSVRTPFLLGGMSQLA